MSDPQGPSSRPGEPDTPIRENDMRAGHGVTGYNVLAVLLTGLGLVAIAFAILFFTVGR